jgi:hypothetical protein
MLSTPNAKFMCLDIKNVYLYAHLDRFEYFQITFVLFTPWIIDQYNLANTVHNGHIYVKMRHAIWGLPQA